MQDAKVLFIFALLLLALFGFEWSQFGDQGPRGEEHVSKEPPRARVDSVLAQPSQRAMNVTTTDASFGKLLARVSKLESQIAGLREDLVNEREENNLLREWVTSQMVSMQSQGMANPNFQLSEPSTDDSSGVVVGVDMTTSKPITLPPYRLRMLWSKPKDGVVNAAFKEQVRAAIDELDLEKQMERRQRRTQQLLNYYTEKLDLNSGQQSQLQAVLAKSREEREKAFKSAGPGNIGKFREAMRKTRQQRNDSIKSILSQEQLPLFDKLMDERNSGRGGDR